MKATKETRFNRIAKNAVQENHSHPLYSGIGTFTQCKLCGIYFYFILFYFLCLKHDKYFFITDDATANNMNKGMTLLMVTLDVICFV